MCPVKSNGRAARCGEPRGKTRDFRRENSGCALRGKSPQAVPKRRAFPETHRYPGLGTPPRLIFNSFRSDSYPTSTQEHSFVLTELCEVMEVFPGADIQAGSGRDIVCHLCGLGIFRLRLSPDGRVSVTPFDPLPEPAGLLALKTEIGHRWPMTSLLNVL